MAASPREDDRLTIISGPTTVRGRNDPAAGSISHDLMATTHLSVFDDLDAAGSNAQGSSPPLKAAIGGAQIKIIIEEKTQPVDAPLNSSSFSQRFSKKAWLQLITFARFTGPGTMIALTCIDVISYTTDVSANPSAKATYHMLFVVLLGNLVAFFLMVLSVRIGSVTGLNLGQVIKLHAPPWLSTALWLIAEASLIVSDVAAVAAIAIALHLLTGLPYVAGCLLSVLEIFVVLLYQPGHSLFALRLFEVFITMIIIAIMACLFLLMSKSVMSPASEVMAGYLPSQAVFTPQSVYQACGIIGATINPYGLYLASGIAQARLLDYDKRHGLVAQATDIDPTNRLLSTTGAPASPTSTMRDLDYSTTELTTPKGTASQRFWRRFRTPKLVKHPNPGQAYYAPSAQALKACFRISVWQLSLTAFVISLVTNSAIMIVASSVGPLRLQPLVGTFLPPPPPPPPDAPPGWTPPPPPGWKPPPPPPLDLVSTSNESIATLSDMFYVLQRHLCPETATLFAASLLICSVAAGLMCNIAGQMISEAQLTMRIPPYLRRTLTRSLAAVPGVVIAASLGDEGLHAALAALQVILCFCLPFTVAPLVWFNARAKYSAVVIAPNGERVVELPERSSADKEGAKTLATTTTTKVTQTQTSTKTITTTELQTVSIVEHDLSPRESSAATDFTSKSGPTGTIAPWEVDERSNLKTVQFRIHWIMTAVGCIILGLIIVLDVVTVALLLSGAIRT